MSNNVTYIPKRLKSISKDDPYVSGAKDIYDDTLEKPQSEVNQDRIEDVATLDGKIALEKQRAEGVESGLNNRLGIVEQLAEISIGGGDAQIATGADFTNPDATKRAKVPTVGAIVDGLNDGVYDVSKRNPSGGPNSDGKFTLEYILSNADTLIPISWRHGGMIISFAHTSDNKYVQFYYMGTSIANTDFANIVNWRGVDKNPIYLSENLIESNAVYKEVTKLDEVIGRAEKHVECNTNDSYISGNGYIKDDGTVNSSSRFTLKRYTITNATRVKIKTKLDSSRHIFVAFYNGEPSSSTFMANESVFINDGEEHEIDVAIPKTAKNFATNVIETSTLIVESYYFTSNITSNITNISQLLANEISRSTGEDERLNNILNFDLIPRIGNSTHEYIDLTVGVGNVVNLTPVAASGSTAVRYYINNVSAGDIIIVNGKGGSAPRLWGFIDSNNILLSVANESADEKNLILYAPSGASKVILNVLINPGKEFVIYKDSILADIIRNIPEEHHTANDSDNIVFDSFLDYLAYTWSKNAVNKINTFLDTSMNVGLPIYPRSMSPGVEGTFYRTMIIPVTEGYNYSITTYQSDSYSPIVFLDKQLVILSKISTGTNGQVNTYNVTTPENAAFMVVYWIGGQTFDIPDVDIVNSVSYSARVVDEYYHIKVRALDTFCQINNWIAPAAERYINGSIDLTAIGTTQIFGWCGVAVRDNNTGVYTLHALQLRGEDADHNNTSVKWEDDGSLIVSYGSGHSQTQYFYVSVITNPLSVNASIETYTYDMGEGNNTSYSQYFHVGGYRHFVMRCVNLGLTFLKVNENDYSDYEIHYVGFNRYASIVGVTENNTMYRMVLAKNPAETIDIKQAFIDFELYKIVDVNGNVLGDIEDLSDILENTPALISPDASFNSLRLFSSVKSSKNETYFTFARYNITPSDTGDDNGEGKYYYYYNGTIIEIGIIGQYWYFESHYFCGEALTSLSKNFVVYGNRIANKSYLYSVYIDGNNMSKSVIKTSDDWIIRPYFISKDETTLLYIEGKVTPEGAPNWQKTKHTIKLMPISVRL